MLLAGPQRLSEAGRRPPQHPNSAGDHARMQVAVRFATGTPESRTLLFPRRGFLLRLKVEVFARGQHDLYSFQLPQACNWELP